MRINSHFSTTLGYGVTFGKGGYMRGSSNISKTDPYGLDLKLQYTTGNLFVSVSANHILRRHGWWKSSLDSEHIHKKIFLSRPHDGFRLMVTASYTFDFGKKTDRNYIRFNGTSKSSALGN